jgi:hypothetical protein
VASDCRRDDVGESGLVSRQDSKATTASGGWAGAVVAASYTTLLHFLILGFDSGVREVRG